jgi:hypothetical protein
VTAVKVWTMTHYLLLSLRRLNSNNYADLSLPRLVRMFSRARTAGKIGRNLLLLLTNLIDIFYITDFLPSYPIYFPFTTHMPIHNKLTPLYLDTLSKVLLLILTCDCLEWYDCLDTTKSYLSTSSIFVQRVHFPFVSWSLLLVDREALSNSIRA